MFLYPITKVSGFTECLIKMYLAEVKRTGHIPVDTQINKKERD